MITATRIRANGNVALVILLGFLTILNAMIGCAAILPALPGPAHSCCPASADPKPANCSKLGCVMSDPAPPSTFLEAINQDSAVVAPGVVSSAEIRPIWDGASLDSRERFVVFHQLLI
jgi:hypothetical protein